LNSTAPAVHRSPPTPAQPTHHTHTHTIYTHHTHTYLVPVPQHHARQPAHAEVQRHVPHVLVVGVTHPAQQAPPQGVRRVQLHRCGVQAALAVHQRHADLPGHHGLQAAAPGVVRCRPALLLLLHEFRPRTKRLHAVVRLQHTQHVGFGSGGQTVLCKQLRRRWHAEAVLLQAHLHEQLPPVDHDRAPLQRAPARPLPPLAKHGHALLPQVAGAERLQNHPACSKQRAASV
jgi:hypothetical protein